ncbi:MAG TPA: glycosyltransferase family 1 protein, partial [Chloroflexi bacterium]|nr:glycosyltransferase family 1 protein [Chloroflexota bacterium]
MLIGIDASRAAIAHPTGTEIYSRDLIRAMLALGTEHHFRLYFRTASPGDTLSETFSRAEQRPIPFPRLWT